MQERASGSSQQLREVHEQHPVRRTCTCLVVARCGHVHSLHVLQCKHVLLEVLKLFDFECLQNSIALYLELLFLETT